MSRKKRFMIVIVLSFILSLLSVAGVLGLCPYEWQQLSFTDPAFSGLTPPSCWNHDTPEQCGDSNEGVHTLIFDSFYQTQSPSEQCYWSECCSSADINGVSLNYIEICYDGNDNDYDTRIDCMDPDCQYAPACQTPGGNPPSIEDRDLFPDYGASELRFTATIRAITLGDIQHVYLRVSDSTFNPTTDCTACDTHEMDVMQSSVDTHTYQVIIPRYEFSQEQIHFTVYIQTLPLSSHKR